MIETREELLNGKSTLIKGKQYFATKDYVQPFFDRLDPLSAEYVIHVKKADQTSVTNGQEDIIYNQVHIQAFLPITSYPSPSDCQRVIGFIYGLDVKTPVVKFYKADVDPDGNLFAFSLKDLIVQELEDSTAIDYSPIQTLLEQENNNDSMITQLETVNYCSTCDELIHKCGEWINFVLTHSYTNEGGKVKLATTMPVNAYKLVKMDKDSQYYILPTQDIKLSDIYRAFAHVIHTDRDIMNNFEKTYLLDQMLGL